MKIAVVGSMNLDMIVHADRIPLKGETIKCELCKRVPLNHILG